MARLRSSATPLAWAYAALIVYASLYPFTGWRVPGIAPWAFWALPWPRWWTGFDLVANLLGYLPLGALTFGAWVRRGRGAGRAMVVAVGSGALLSFALETLQNYLPQRVASNVDFGLNAAGAALGAALGLGVHLRGWVDQWQLARDRWFIAHSAGGLALLLLWPFGLLFPTPLPLGIGQVLDQLQQSLEVLLDGTPVAPWLDAWIDAGLERTLSPIGEWAVMALGLLAPCLTAFSISRPGWRRLVLVAGAAALGVAATTLSTALAFGPQHALAWNSVRTMTAIGTAFGVAGLLSAVPRRAAAGLGLMALTALVVLVANAPADPYFADSLQNWEQGRFIRFHGAAQWVGWLWPYAAIGYLLARIGARDEDAPAARPGGAAGGAAGETAAGAF